MYIKLVNTGDIDLNFLEQMYYYFFYFFYSKRIKFIDKLISIEEEFPRGLLLEYNGIEFFVKEYSSIPDIISNIFHSEKIYIITEYYDIENKCFVEKSFHENFFRNRIKLQNKLIGVNN